MFQSSIYLSDFNNFSKSKKRLLTSIIPYAYKAGVD